MPKASEDRPPRFTEAGGIAQCTLHRTIRCAWGARVFLSAGSTRSSIWGPTAAWVQQTLYFLAQRRVLGTGPIQECAPFWRADVECRVVDFFDPFPPFRHHSNILGFRP